jgi:shikimate kinase
MENQKGITLIGMPGSGKSTIGKLLAKKSDRKFIDLDILIKVKSGKSHTDILAEQGDSALLKLEEFYTLGLDFTDTVFSPGGSIVYSRTNTPRVSAGMEARSSSSALFPC